MAQNNYKILISSPQKKIFQLLQKKLLYQNVEIFYLSQIAEIAPFVQKVQPQLVILKIDASAATVKSSLKLIAKLHQQPFLWQILLVNHTVADQKLISALPEDRILILDSTISLERIVYNVQMLKNLFEHYSRLETEKRIEEHFNYCLKIIHQEFKLHRLFDRLVNYLPKVISMDYWGIFNLDKSKQLVENFSQFVPPTRRNTPIMTPHLEKLIESWIKRGKAFSLAQKEDPLLFKKMSQWGWPIKKLYFLPAILQDQILGGLILGGVTKTELQAEEIRLLNNIVKLLAERIFELNRDVAPAVQQDDYLNQLIVNRFSEDSIFYLTCKKINQITRGSSTVFWQYNKGFGFIFPKYFYFKEGEGGWQSLEKNVIFMNKETFLHQLLSDTETKILREVAADTRLDKATRKTFQDLKYENLLILPIHLEQEITGAIVVNKTEPQATFNVWEIQNVQEVIDQFHKILQDTYVVKEAQLKLKQLARIFELGNEIKLDLKLDQILDRIALNLRKSMGWNDVAFLLIDEFSRELRPESILGFTNKLKLNINVRKPIPLKEMESFLSSCRTIGNSYFFESQPLGQNKINGGLFSEQLTTWHENDVLIVPIETRKSLLGYLVLHDPVDRLKPTPDRVVPLEYYASQAAMAVENIQLYERLAASEERYRTLAETMSLGLVTCDMNANIIYVNPAFHKLIQFKPEKVLHRKLTSFFGSQSKSRLEEIIDQLTGEKGNRETYIENVELNLLNASGENIPVSVFAFPLFQQKKKSGFFIVVNDLRVIKRLERMKADFNSMIVHDLRSPMNVIQGFIELIRNRVVGEINEEQEELLDIAKENVKKVLTLIDNFLVASKIEVGKFDIEPKLNEINALIERVIENHQILLKNKNIKFQLKLDKNLPLLFFDNLRIEQVLNNLISNALKFTPENGKIEIASSLLKKRIKGEEKFFACVAVKDTGIGIPEDKINKIFERYEQVGNNGKINSQGTGLGLSICREIVHLHGGEIWAKSQVNKGSTFYFTLPIEPTLRKVIK